MHITHCPWGWRALDEFPAFTHLGRWMTGDAFSADKDGKFYLIVDESVLAGVQPANDPTRDELVTVLEFDTFPDRESYLRRFKVYEKFSPRS